MKPPENNFKNGNKCIFIDNYFKCKQTKISVKRRVWLDELKKNKTQLCAAYKKFTTDIKTHTYRNEVMEKDIPCKQKPKEIWGSYTYLGQNRHYNKGSNKRQRRKLHDHRVIYQEDITFQSIYAPKIGGLKYIKQILTDLKGEIDSSTIKVGRF